MRRIVVLSMLVATLFGQIGLRPDRPTMAQGVGSEGLTGVVAIAAGNAHALALREDGSVWAWGNNALGQLGTPFGDTCSSEERTWPCATRPVRVAGVSEVTAIAAGDAFSLALKNDGTVWGWGSNHYGPLGSLEDEHCPMGEGIPVTPVSPPEPRPYPCVRLPRPIPGLEGVTAIAVGPNHALAVRADGTVWGWGDNRAAQLGLGFTSEQEAPTQVPGLSDATAVATGWINSAALGSDGTVWGWGLAMGGESNEERCPYMNFELACYRSPRQLEGLVGIRRIDAGALDGFAIGEDGRLWGWGGIAWLAALIIRGPQLDPPEPVVVLLSGVVPVPQMQGVVTVASGFIDWLFVMEDGSLWRWRLGQMWPLELPAMPMPEWSGVVAVTSTFNYAYYVLRNDGTVWAWGPNENGQLGDGTRENRETAVRVGG